MFIHRKKTLHDVTNKTAYINSFFLKKYDTLFIKPVKKIIYPEKINGKENIMRVAKHNIVQQWEEIFVERYVSKFSPL